jgi:hypothetical protein
MPLFPFSMCLLWRKGSLKEIIYFTIDAQLEMRVYCSISKQVSRSFYHWLVLKVCSEYAKRMLFIHAPVASCNISILHPAGKAVRHHSVSHFSLYVLPGKARGRIES